MSNFNFQVLGNYSPNIRMFGKKNCTCYRLIGFEKDILLDFGTGVYKKFIKLVEDKTIDLNNLIIIISHNHVDHCLSLFPLVKYLRKINKDAAELTKVTVYMPNRSVIYSYMQECEDVLNLKVLNEDVKFKIGKASFKFCKTIHKGESYATKIEYKNKRFVYTSDLAKYSMELEDFVRGTETVLLDAGYPQKILKTFSNYHGKTSDILSETESLGVKKIYASHIRFFSKKKDYINSFPEKARCYLVKQDSSYSILE